MALWRASEPLVLASKSAIRRSVLESAGVSVEVAVADIDEGSFIAKLWLIAPVAGAVSHARRRRDTLL